MKLASAFVVWQFREGEAEEGLVERSASDQRVRPLSSVLCGDELRRGGD